MWQLYFSSSFEKHVRSSEPTVSFNPDVMNKIPVGSPNTRGTSLNNFVAYRNGNSEMRKGSLSTIVMRTYVPELVVCLHFWFNAVLTQPRPIC